MGFRGVLGGTEEMLQRVPCQPRLPESFLKCRCDFHLMLHLEFVLLINKRLIKSVLQNSKTKMSNKKKSRLMIYPSLILGASITK